MSSWCPDSSRLTGSLSSGAPRDPNVVGAVLQRGDIAIPSSGAFALPERSPAISTQTASIPECRRAIASVTLLTAYGAACWTRSEIYLAVAQAWLTACACILRFAVVRMLDSKLSLPSYDLAFEGARTSLAALATEAADARDLVVPRYGRWPRGPVSVRCSYAGFFVLTCVPRDARSPDASAHIRASYRDSAHQVERGTSRCWVKAASHLLHDRLCAWTAPGELQRSEGLMLSFGSRSCRREPIGTQRGARPIVITTLSRCSFIRLARDSDLDGEAVSTGAHPAATSESIGTGTSASVDRRSLALRSHELLHAGPLAIRYRVGFHRPHRRRAIGGSRRRIEESRVTLR